MGCGGSAPEEVGEVVGDDRPQSENSGSRITETQHSKIHRRLKKLQELDDTTRIPFLLVELRGISNEHGFVEICGKDEYGVYEALDTWLTSTWGCVKLDAGDLSEDTIVPFCDVLYDWKGVKMIGTEGTNNIGLCTMRLVGFMTGELGWTLGVINGGNVGAHGEIREQQVIFKAPHPMNLVAPHLMVEIRSAGFIEACSDLKGSLSNETLDTLEEFFVNTFQAERQDGHEEFCDRFYTAGSGMFMENQKTGENNLGLLTARICDAVVQIRGWSLVTVNGGNYGESGNHREQQLVFRWDNHPLGENPHLLVELRDAGYVEVCGQDYDGIYIKLQEWLGARWRCTRAPDNKALFDAKFRWSPKDMMVSTGEIIGFFHHLGWQMQVCSQGTVKVKDCDDSREQQIVLRPGASGLDIVEPHLIVELYMGEGTPELYADDHATQVLGNQHIRMCPIGNDGVIQSAVREFHQFIVQYMGGSPGEDRYDTEVFLGRGFTDNNLGQWTMRVCDFMVDRLGWSFVVCNVCNMGEHGQFREQQLVFRYDGPRREVPKARGHSMGELDIAAIMDGLELPSYWTCPEVLGMSVIQKSSPCSKDEVMALQNMMDTTFKRVLTRDRVYEYQANTDEEMPYHLEVIHAFRSENLTLYKRFSERVANYNDEGEDNAVKSRGSGCAPLLNSRLGPGEAYLFHGTNPSSSMSILKTGFSLDAAGKSTGTMFGYGIYLAECSSKSDEYARDDGGNTFPGLNAMLVCRTLVGKAMSVLDAGDFIDEARSNGCDVVIGDREKKVGTYREFIFFDEAQIMPEFTVIYRRNYDSSKAPKELRRKAAGTTGRFWQVKLDKGWASVSPAANRALIAAMNAGQDKIENIDIGGMKYDFDLSEKTQTNLATGTTRTLRPPMVK
eukprot:TRINITY_DN9093_c0_g1_i1.p1 TRINITY_DN9093_c0_g1~~TRINITY_DN9093_c0_g1_i1.p1  ORF type:complete len:896 (+),score=161.62 TRINITY_DN9093_c0_g1_i1:74-2761(+)